VVTVELEVEAASLVASGRDDVLRRRGEVGGIVRELFAHQLSSSCRGQTEGLSDLDT
jgi:hypothetical protein